MDLERDLARHLARHLARTDPPLDFTRGVMARLPARRPPVWRWAGLAAAAGLLVTVSLTRYHEYRQGQHAKAQLLLALEITAEKFAVAQEITRRSISE